MSANKIFQNFPEKLGGTHVENFIGDPGMIFYDPNTGELRLGNGVDAGGISLFKALASNFGVSADGGNTIPSGFDVIVYDGGNATSPFNIYEVLDGNTSIVPSGFSANDQYNFTNTVTFSNTVTVGAGIKAAGVLGNAGQVLTSTGYNVVWGNPSIANNTTLKFSNGAAIVSDNSDAEVNVPNGNSYSIHNFSGMLIVNDHYDGGVALYIAGGGTGILVSNTNSAFNTGLSINYGTGGYDWINSTNLTGPFTFTVIKTRNGN